MAPHKPRKPDPVEYITDEKDMIIYDVEEDEIEKKPVDDFVLPEFFRKNPHEYRAHLFFAEVTWWLWSRTPGRRVEGSSPGVTEDSPFRGG
ncbi:hypothetical protein TNCV_216181 [Trichonephila clavipes]|nr:hypothetical protein TNCV_216181 [Trichonephila clavipes]